MKKFLLAMGVIFSALIGMLIGGMSYVGVKAANSAESNKELAVSLVTTLSKTWRAEGRRDVFTPAALKQVESPNGRQAIQVMSRLGKLMDVEGLKQTGFKMTYGAPATATVRFTGKFEFGTSDVELTLQVDGEDALIIELDLENIRLDRPQSIRRTA